MARVLAISSFVAYGHVGLSAIVPTLQRLGHEVVSVPTVILSNHYGYDEVGGFPVDAARLVPILNTLRTNEWLSEADAVITGYMKDQNQVSLVARCIADIVEDNPDLIYLCDPVIGDDPHGLYVDTDVATAVRDKLFPLADIVTPNRYELTWLTGEPVTNAGDADAAAEALDAELVVATSIPGGEGRLATVISDADSAAHVSSPHYDGVPHGTGDLFSALFLGHLLNGCDDGEALGLAAAGTDVVIRASLGAEELRLVDSLDEAVRADPFALEEIA